MSSHALVDMSCPHCKKHFVENAQLVRPGGEAWCPECEQLFALDETNAAIRQMLSAAKAARRRRKDRINELRQIWADPPQAATPADTPRTLTEVLAVLDGLLLQLDRRTDDKAA